MSYIQVDDVQKEYGDFLALRGVSLDVAEGEFVSLLGPSGCGKTSLLRSIAGLEDIHGGSISVNGTVMSKKGYTMPPERRKVGLIFQSYALWPHMTVFKNIAYGLKLNGWDTKAIRGRVSEVLDVVGLEGLESRLPAQLSGGQMQRVAVARSIAASPAVLLFDEPLSNLDAKLRETMRFELRRIQKSVGTTAVYVTHDQAEAMVISDRIILMNHGVIVQEGTARELYETPESAFAARFLGFSNLLPASVESLDAVDGTGTFQLDGLQAPIIVGRGREGMKQGDAVSLSIRPESIRVRPRGSAADDNSRMALPASVRDVVYSGNLCDVFLDVQGTTIRAQVMPSDFQQMSAGDGVEAVFEQRNVWPVPADGSEEEIDELLEVGTTQDAEVEPEGKLTPLG